MARKRKTECPLARLRGVLRLTRNDLAKLAGTSYTRISLVETGYFAAIPSGVISAVAPFLASAGTTPEELQKEFRSWRGLLAEEVRRRTARRSEMWVER